MFVAVWLLLLLFCLFVVAVGFVFVWGFLVVVVGGVFCIVFVVVRAFLGGGGGRDLLQLIDI